MYKFLILFSSFFLVVAKKCDTKNSAACTEMGTVKDMAGLDGCGLMIVMDNGDKLQPMKYADSDVNPRDGQRIKFGYQEVTNQVGICMAGKMVEITCLEIMETTATAPPRTGGVKPMKKECVETMNPYYNEWMKNSMRETNAYQVTRYVYRTDGFAYYFAGPTSNMILDCQGTLICESGSRDTKCDDVAKRMTGGTVIWEKD